MAASPEPGKHKCGDRQRFWHSIPSSCICWPILLKIKDSLIKTFFPLKSGENKMAEQFSSVSKW